MQSIDIFTQYLNSVWMRIALRGAKRPSIRSGKWLKVREFCKGDQVVTLEHPTLGL